MRILVTGAAGSVGSNVARGLKDRHEVRGHDRVPNARSYGYHRL